MTTTLLRSGTSRTPAADVLRGLLDEVLQEVADDDTDGYSSRTPAGRALLSLAALARRAAGGLGAEPGVALTWGPGIVVQRELSAAAHLLDGAVAAAGGEPPEVADLLVPARRLREHLHQGLHQARAAR